MDEWALVRRLRSGSRLALEQAIRQFTPYVSAVILRTLAGRAAREDVEEITADVFLALWAHAGELDPDLEMRPWLSAVARNRALDWLRRRREEALPLEEGQAEEGEDPQAAVELVVELCRTRLPQNMGVDGRDIQVLCPTRRGEWGTRALNRALQEALNPPAPDKRQKVWGELVFRVGDRVMQIRNNYDVLWVRSDGVTGAGIFNGDVGVVEDIDPAGELMTVRFDDRTATYVSDMLGELELAYAVTVHKSQGSEYRAVVLVALPAAPALMVRGVLYTGITRARELLVVVGDDAALGRMAENDRQQRRYSGLRWRLCQSE